MVPFYLDAFFGVMLISSTLHYVHKNNQKVPDTSKFSPKNVKKLRKNDLD
jgi:hypothetical protein